MKKLVGTHAEDVGGLIVEPGREFDDSAADGPTVERLQAEGLVIDLPSSKKKPATTSEA